MSTLDPAVRDLVATIDLALDAPEANFPELRAAVRSMRRFSDPAGAARWLAHNEQRALERADARRVRQADRIGLYDREAGA
jgi:hypothetical protein